MPDNIPVTPQAGESDQETQSQVDNLEPQAGESRKPLTADDYEKLVTKLRRENAEHRVKLKTFEDGERTRSESQLTEQQRLQKAYDELASQHQAMLTEHQETKVRSSVERQARQLGVIDEDAAVRLLDWSELDYDDAGNPTNVETLLKQLLKQRPYLVQGNGRPANGGGATNPSWSNSRFCTDTDMGCHLEDDS